MAEETPLWRRTASFYGAPFIWCMLNDFGGNNGMWGDFASLNSGPSEARGNGSTIAGAGTTPEGIFQNAAAFDLMNENAYKSAPVDLDSWSRDYGSRRYGARTEPARTLLRDAWARTMLLLLFALLLMLLLQLMPLLLLLTS